MIELYPDILRSLDNLASILAHAIPDGSLRFGDIPVLDMSGNQVGKFVYNKDEYCWFFYGEDDFFNVRG